MDVKKSLKLPKKLGMSHPEAYLKLQEWIIEETAFITIDWTQVDSVHPASYSLLSLLHDLAAEKQVILHHLNVPKKIKDHFPHPFLKSETLKNGLPNSNIHFFSRPYLLSAAYEGGITMDFSEKMGSLFRSILSETQLFHVNLVMNELMQNSVDHSSAERYYLFAGVNGSEFEFGVLDMGVGMPAKLEQKYLKERDIDYLELGLKEGISTRRMRVGGLGLFHTLNILKNLDGRMTIFSRNGSIRRYLGHRRVARLELKQRLRGTWIFLSFRLSKDLT